MIEQIHTSRGLLYRQSTRCDYHTSWVAKGVVGIEEVYNLLPLMIPDQKSRCLVEEVMDKGSEALISLLNDGGVIASQGKVYVLGQDATSLVAQVAHKLDEKNIIDLSVPRLRREEKIILPVPFKYMHDVIVVRKGADRLLGYYVPDRGNRSIHFSFGDKDGWQFYEHNFEGFFDRPYSELNLPHYISSQSLVRMLMIDLSEAVGRGRVEH